MVLLLSVVLLTSVTIQGWPFTHFRSRFFPWNQTKLISTDATTQQPNTTEEGTIFEMTLTTDAYSDDDADDDPEELEEAVQLDEPSGLRSLLSHRQGSIGKSKKKGKGRRRTVTPVTWMAATPWTKISTRRRTRQVNNNEFNNVTEETTLIDTMSTEGMTDTDTEATTVDVSTVASTITTTEVSMSTTQCPETAISNVTFTSSIDSITLSWNASNDTDEYQVRIEDSDWSTVKDNNFTWNALDPCSWYRVSVRAVSVCENNATTLSVQTKEVLTNISGVRVDQPQPSNLTVIVEWTLLAGPCAANITAYHISWKSADGTNGTEVVDNPNGHRSLVLPHHYSSYVICVTAVVVTTQLDSTTSCVDFNTSIGVPGEPQNLNITAKSRSVDIQWDAPNELNGPSVSYVISVDKYVKRTPNTSVTFEGFCPKTRYSTQIVAVSVYNETTNFSSANVSGDFVTENESPPPVRNLNVTEINCTLSMQMMWEPPDPLCPNFTKDYLIKVTDSNNETKHKYNVTDIVENVPVRSHFTNYTFCVRAISKGDSENIDDTIGKKSCKTVQTCVGVPEYVVITETSVTSRNVTLIWNRPNNPNGPIDFYEIEYHNAFSNITKSINITKENYTIPDLDPCTSYIIDVLAVNRRGDQLLKSSTTNLRLSTGYEPPNVTAEAHPLNSSALDISWRADVPANCANENFSVTATALNNDFHSKPKSEITANRSLIMTGLNPYTLYKVCVVVVVRNSREYCLNVPTPEAEEAPLPMKVQLSCNTASKCSVEWTMPQVQQGPMIYVVDLLNKTGVEETSGEISRHKYSQWEKVDIDDLQPYTEYTAVVRVIMSNKTNKQTSKPNRTAPAVPERPSSFRVICADEVKVAEMAPPTRVTGQLERFQLSFIGTRPNYTADRDRLEIHPNITSYTLDLKPQHFYKFELRAKNKDIDELSSPFNTECYVPAIAPPKPDLKQALFKDNIILKSHRQIELTFDRKLFREDNGDIRNYTIILYEEQSNVDLTDVHSVWIDVYNGVIIRPYQVTPNNWSPFVNFSNANNDMCCSLPTDSAVKCVLGCQEDCFDSGPKPCNGPLRPDTNYRIVVRVYTDGGYADSDPIPLSTEPEENTGAAVTLGICLTLLVLVAGAVGYIHYRRRDIKFFLSFRPRKMESETQTPQDGVIFENKARTRMVKLCDYAAHLQNLNKDMRFKFSEEYEELKGLSPSHSTSIAQLPENRSKNRWVNILPFDYCRVKLLAVADDASSDYINASYIPGFNSQREYIATQGPLPGTKDDFWRMVWEQSCCMIVMVTQLMERGKVKCEQYWPDDREVHYYGDLSVQMTSESILSGFTIRIFDLHLGTNKLIVKQMHFTKWPDFGCPETTGLLINFVRAVREHMPHSVTGPIVVHCSAGVGRTGTFIAVDCLMQHVQFHDTIDIYGKVLEMRQYRANMVQTEDQYVYIHECVRDILNATERQNNGESIYANFGSLDRDSKM